MTKRIIMIVIFALAISIGILIVARWPLYTPERESASSHAPCQVHNIIVIEEKVPIVYGLLITSLPEYSKAHKELFPNSKRFVAGGCGSGPDSPKTEQALYCPSCRHAEIAWGREQAKQLISSRH